MAVPNIRRLLSENPVDVDEWLSEVSKRWDTGTSKKTSDSHPKAYSENIATFDIETTSFRLGDHRLALMYVWMLDVCECVIYGRTWEQLVYVLECLDDRFDLRRNNVKLPIFVHNLSFEFSFMYSYFDWDDIFALDSRSPIRATTGPFEFRDSLVLFGTKLAAIKLHDHKAAKMVGDLDYRPKRTPKTPLTDEEWGYCYQDVNVLSLAIREKLHDNNDTMATMPMTRTGYVRREVRRRMSRDPKAMDLVRSLTMTKEVYDMLRELYQGGFTHTGNYASRKVHKNVASHDFRSSYPAVIVSEKYPMSKFTRAQPARFAYYYTRSDNWAMMFRVRITGLKEKFIFEHPISESHGLCLNPTVDNGRVVSADIITIVADENDWATIKDAYTWTTAEVIELYVARKEYLPKPIVEYMMQCYKAKTELKGDKAQLIYYNLSKEVCNSIYGMMVTDPIKTTWFFDPTNNECLWGEEMGDPDEMLKRYNKNKSRCLYYAWGVWVTSYARRNLWRGIFEFGPDYCYSDTDSIKGRMTPEHQQWIDDYNLEITAKVKACLTHHGLDPKLAEPVSRKGAVCPIGQWDYEGTYIRFKALGAKRYMYETDDHDKYHCTVAGIGKKEEYIEGQEDNRPLRLPDYLQMISPSDPFAAFDDGLEVPEEYTGKLTHTYFDSPASGTLVDYLGESYDFTVVSGTNLEGQPYKLSMADEYVKYLAGLGSNPFYA